jgi:cadmium resistance protein CadD (predicted permease)
LDFLAIIGIGVAAFAATDIDDLFVLMLFFSYPTYKAPKSLLDNILELGCWYLLVL